MKKNKTIIVVIVLLVTAILFLYFRYFYGWYEFKFYKKTPKEYLNTTKVDKKKYSSDSTKIVMKAYQFVKEHKESLYSKNNYESTQIIVDTILYSPNFKKIATIIIAKNPTSRQLMPNKKYNWYYDGAYYIGNIDKDSININWIGALYTNYNDLGSISKIIRSDYFDKYSSTKDNNGNEKLYNLDDIRYWDKSVDWKNLEYTRKMQKDFEIEKLKNPENVYEPK